MGSNETTRRRVIGTLGAAGLAGLAGCGGGSGDETTDGGGTETTDGGETETTEGMATPQDVSGTITVGLLQPTSGPLQPYGTEALAGIYSALGYKGDRSAIPGSDGLADDPTVEVDGITYDFQVRDTQASTGVAQELASNLVQNEGVDILVGATSSAAALAIANNVAAPEGVPYMAGPAATVSLTGTGSNCNALVFRASENVAMDALSGGQYIANQTDISSVYIYYANYSFGRSVNRYYSKVLTDNGVSVRGSTPLPQGYAEDWPAQFQKAVDADVDAIIGGFTVATLPEMVGTFVRNRADYPFTFAGGYTTRVGAFSIGGTIAQELGGISQESLSNLNFGPFTTRYHWNQYDNPINSSFVDIHTEKYGYYPDLFSSGTFTGMAAIHEAARIGGSTDPLTIAQTLRGYTVRETPKGENGYTFQEYNNQARSAMTVSDPIPTPSGNEQFWRFAGQPVPFQPGEPTQTYDKSQTTLQPDDATMTCDLTEN